MTTLRSLKPYTCRRILPETGKVCAVVLREEDRNQCEPCDYTEARAWDRFMHQPVNRPAMIARPEPDRGVRAGVWP